MVEYLINVYIYIKCMYNERVIHASLCDQILLSSKTIYRENIGALALL